MGRSAPVAASRSAACACRPVRMPSSRYRLVAFHISFSRFTSIRSMSRRITVPSMLRTLHVHSQAWMAPASMGQPARWHASRVVLLGMIWRGCAPMGGRIPEHVRMHLAAKTLECFKAFLAVPGNAEWLDEQVATMKAAEAAAIRKE